MLEQTANFVGKDGFNWWIGQVENDGGGFYNFVNGGFDFEDWDWTNKVKVRIMGYHNPSRVELPTEDLPWAMVVMPNTTAQRSGIGTMHQLQINSWVVGFFMDGTSSQIPIVLGSIGDENPTSSYGVEGGKKEGFAQLGATDWKKKNHGEKGTMPPGTGPNVETDSKTGLDKASTTGGGTGDGSGSSEEGTDDSKNPRSAGEKPSEVQDDAEEDKKVTVHLGNGKCGSELATKLEAPIKEFMKTMRTVEANAAGKFINKKTGEIVDIPKEVANITGRVQTKLNGMLSNIKGKVLEETNKLVQKGLDDINIPDPDLDGAVKEQLKDVGGLISCLFKDLLSQLGDFIKGMFNDLIANALDSALCLVQDFINEIMSKVMDKIRNVMSILQGVTGAIKGAADQIQGLISKIADLADLFCAPDIGCALDASVFETGFGAKAQGNDLKQKQIDQYPVKPSVFGQVVGNGIPKNGFVPFVNNLGVKQIFDTKGGGLIDLASPEALATGIGVKDFDTRGPLEKFEGLNFYGADGKISSATLDCSNTILNKKPCFPEMVWDNLQSTSPVKALPIIDDIGQILGVMMRKKGSRVGIEAKVRAQFTCNDPEGGGATFRPNIIDGGVGKGNIVDSVEVLTPGIGYGFDPAETYCPKEQYVITVRKSNLIQHVNDGELIRIVKYANGDDGRLEDVMQVVDTDWSDDHILLATIDPLWAVNVEIGMILKTLSGHEFVLNYERKYPDLVIPTSAVAIYAGCNDLIPTINSIETVNVGDGYINPVITIGTGVDKEEIGSYTVDSDGKLVEPNITKKVFGFVNPIIEDKGFPEKNISGTGSGGLITPTYGYSGPREIKESGVLALQTYVDCVGHPVLEQNS